MPEKKGTSGRASEAKNFLTYPHRWPGAHDRDEDAANGNGVAKRTLERAKRKLASWP
jgi:hypothetical protein